MTYAAVAGQFQGTVKRPRSGRFPNGWNDPPSLAYEISQLRKTNHTTFHGHCLPSAMAHTLWSMLLSESDQIHLLSIAVSLTEFFSMRHQEPELH